MKTFLQLSSLILFVSGCGLPQSGHFWHNLHTVGQGTPTTEVASAGLSKERSHAYVFYSGETGEVSVSQVDGNYIPSLGAVGPFVKFSVDFTKGSDLRFQDEGEDIYSRGTNWKVDLRLTITNYSATSKTASDSRCGDVEYKDEFFEGSYSLSMTSDKGESITQTGPLKVYGAKPWCYYEGD